MKAQRKRLVPVRPHKPGFVRWHRVIGHHRRHWVCGGAGCRTKRPNGKPGRRAAVTSPFLPF